MHVAKTPHHTQIVERNMYNSGLPAERAILCKEVARLHGEGMSIATACAKAGLGMRSWYRYVEEYARVDMWYKQALRRRADAVAQSVYELSTGKAGKRRDEYGAEGELNAMTLGDVFASFGHDSECHQPQEVHFEQAKVIDAIHFVLRDRLDRQFITAARRSV